MPQNFHHRRDRRGEEMNTNVLNIKINYLKNNALDIRQDILS